MLLMVFREGCGIIVWCCSLFVDNYNLIERGFWNDLKVELWFVNDMLVEISG